MASALPSLPKPPALVRWWAVKGRNERLIVVALGVLIVAAIGWLLVWQPVHRDMDALRISVPIQRRALATAQRMAEEIAGLSRKPPAAAASDPRADLDRILSQQGLRGVVTQLDLQEGRARLVFAAVSFDALVQALETLQRETGLRLAEASLTARVEPGAVRAELVLTR